MSNPLLSHAENAQLAAIRNAGASQYPQHTPDRNHFAGQLVELYRRIDWHKIFVWTVRALVVVAFGFAVSKLVVIWHYYPGMAFIPFLDMHPLLMLFSGLFTFNFIQKRETEGVAIIAMLSTLLNAQLV